MSILIVKLVGILLGADLLTGFVHWWEDAYGNPDWKFFGNSIVKPNLEHHQLPRKFLKDTFIQRVGISVIAGICIAFTLWCFSLYTWEIGLLLALAAMGNEVHAMAHRTDKENRKLVVLLQKTGLLQSRKMHGHHHKSPYNVNYCILTNYLNPTLSWLNFWNKLELILATLNIKTTRNLPTRNGY